MKILFLAMMMTGMSLNAMGQTTEGDDHPTGELTRYQYTIDEDVTYEVRQMGSEYLLYINDKDTKTEGYCMIDSIMMAELRAVIGSTTLQTVKEDYRQNDAPKKAKTWRLRLKSTWGPGEEDYHYLSHYGYTGGKTEADNTAMQKTNDVLTGINHLLREHLTTQQTRFGSLRIACMEHTESGYMRMFVTEDGRQISPKNDFYYFNFGDYCVAEACSNTPEPSIKRQQFDRTKAEQISQAVELERYKKPLREVRVFDAPNSVYTFYFFDGLCVSFNIYYRSGYKGKWIIPNAYIVEQILKEKQ